MATFPKYVRENVFAYTSCLLVTYLHNLKSLQIHFHAIISVDAEEYVIVQDSHIGVMEIKKIHVQVETRQRICCRSLNIFKGIVMSGVRGKCISLLLFFIEAVIIS